jgi:uncharacterized coiled-coil protein SlyX
MEALVRIEEKLDDFMTEARAHWAREEERMRLIDQFVDPNIELVGTLVGLRDALNKQRDMLALLNGAVTEHERTVHTAMQLRLGTQDLRQPRTKKKAS